jgi:hypothetical protein
VVISRSEGELSAEELRKNLTAQPVDVSIDELVSTV